MPEQIELECVSCEKTFEPAPNGGFCPDCDTPHPDHDRPDEESDDSDADDSVEESIDEWADEEEEADDDADEESDEPAADADEEDDADDAASEEDVEVEYEEDDDESADEAATVDCGSCGSSVDASASFCPDCGAELGATDDESDSLEACPDCGNSVDDESFCPDCGTHLDPIRDGETPDEGEAPDESDADASDDGTPETVTLVVGGEEHTFGDGDTFGRQDADWLDDLVAAAGGREAATYVSGDHLEFSVEDDGVYVRDVSTNGTKRNGTDLEGETAQLEDGDVLELAGRAEVEVKL
ncbi:FHA domain-containing protein [Halovivax sp.]|uniref:FHA domain-containing protein n=1 Tax=Halovivax sp. TaxID=1935978 RepID=UPI0025B81EB0|nr:zinc ribbon domain-containing protein [Halovivax sp.]